MSNSTNCNSLQHAATYWNTLQQARALSHTQRSTHCISHNTLQHTATHYNSLQHIATHTRNSWHIYLYKERERERDTLTAGNPSSWGKFSFDLFRSQKPGGRRTPIDIKHHPLGMGVFMEGFVSRSFWDRNMQKWNPPRGGRGSSEINMYRPGCEIEANMHLSVFYESCHTTEDFWWTRVTESCITYQWVVWW